MSQKTLRRSGLDIQTAISHFNSNDQPPVAVVSMFHVGSPSYFTAIQERLDEFTADGYAIHVEANTGGNGRSSGTIMGALERQSLLRHRAAWRTYDIDPKIYDYISDIVENGRQLEGLQQLTEGHGRLGLLRSLGAFAFLPELNGRNHTKRSAHSMDHAALSDAMTYNIRSQIALNELWKYRKLYPSDPVALVWGQGHAEYIHNGLVHNGLAFAGQEWYTAWGSKQLKQAAAFSVRKALSFHSGD